MFDGIVCHAKAFFVFKYLFANTIFTHLRLLFYLFMNNPG
jgi:hypothetical protein